ncbi:Ger(x)C family spore germination C-terminal domain-containing protein [Bacillus paranthracis]
MYWKNNLKSKLSKLLKKVQKQYGTDIFGFGEAIHRKYPSEWKGLKKELE